MNVWTYWEGPRPPFIDKCLLSLSQACRDDDFQLVTPETLYDYICPKAIYPRYKNIKEIGVRVDCIRAALLASHGGWWLDADTIGLQSPSCITREVLGPKAIYMAWDRMPYRILDGYIYLTREIAGEWLRKINDVLQDNFHSAEWCSLGERILTPLLTSRPATMEIPRRLFLPVDIDSNVESFFSDSAPESLIQPDTVCFGLNHSYMMYHRPEIMAPPWNEPRLIHRLLQSVQESPE